MVIPDWKTLPLDADAVAAASGQDLEYRLVDPTDPTAIDAFLHAVSRGFFEPDLTDELLSAQREEFAFRRMSGVFDPASTETPIATVDSWMTDLTLSVGRSLPMWAISHVTVAPTHRRRGLARTLLEAELRTAAGAGAAIAGLTVSEATIYGRFGFSPATFSTDWQLDTNRTQWIGPRPDGRVDMVSREDVRDLLPTLHERVRQTRPGEIRPWPGRWWGLTGTTPGAAQSVRGLRYTDAAGQTRGLATYRVREDPTDFTKHTLDVLYLLAETDDAYAALWRILLEHDLVSTVTARLLSIDEPLRWMINDQRGAHMTIREHGWLRVLDVGVIGRNVWMDS